MDTFMGKMNTIFNLDEWQQKVSKNNGSLRYLPFFCVLLDPFIQLQSKTSVT